MQSKNGARFPLRRFDFNGRDFGSDAEFGEEIVALVINDDEGREVFAEFGI